MDDSVFMIRDAMFGRDFTPKLATAVIAVALVVWDAVRHKRLDYVWVFTFGTVIWGSAEAFLHLQGIRDMPVRTLFEQQISLPLSYVLQGMAEGAFVAVVGLFIGDRLLEPAVRRRAIAGLAIALLVIASATIRSFRRTEGLGEVASRRDLLSPTALGLLLVAVVITVVFVWKWAPWRPRTYAMFAVMLVIASVWTVTQVALGGRWVEVGSAATGFRDAGSLITVLALAFDVVIEIAVTYVPFLAIPVMLRLMRDPAPLPSLPTPSAQVRPEVPLN